MRFTRTVSVDATAAHNITEAVVRTTHVHGHSVKVNYGPGNFVDNVFVPIKGSIQRHRITGDDYINLMSDAPDWSPNKPANTFNDEDLLLLIDELLERA